MIETEVQQGVGILTINRPQSRNALAPDHQHQLIAAFRALSAEPDVGAIIITGAGTSFCSGGDIKAMALPTVGSVDEQITDLRARENIVMAIRTAPQVVIARIRGAATGAGLAIALACDFRICDLSARFGAVYARVGLTGDFGITWLLQSEIGARHARAMLLSAEIIDAQTALSYGLVHELVDDVSLEDHVMARAQQYAMGPRLAYARIKQNLLEASQSSLERALDFEAERLIAAKQTADHKEAIAAFSEKRKPAFSGQ